MKVYNTLITINDDGNVHTKLETFSNIDSAANYLFCEYESLKRKTAMKAYTDLEQSKKLADILPL